MVIWGGMGWSWGLALIFACQGREPQRAREHFPTLINPFDMAGSRWAYVRNFELPDTLLPNTFILLRIDGHAFHRCAYYVPFIAHQFPTQLAPTDLRTIMLL